MIPVEPALPALVRPYAHCAPSVPAVCVGNRQLTYGQLWDQAHCVARALRIRGVGPEAKVVVDAVRSPELVIALLAIGMAGGVFVPVSRDGARERLRRMESDLRPVAVIGSGGVSIPELTAEGRISPDAAAREINTTVEPGNLAYVIHSSGTTGRPKAVAITQSGIADLVMTQVRTLGIEAGVSRVLQCAAPTFDAAISEIAMALGGGATLVIPEPHQTETGDALRQTLLSSAITHITLPPILLGEIGDPHGLPEDLVVVVAGEACPEGLARRWRRYCTLVNGYGPSETTVCTTMAALDSVEGRIPLGQEVSGTRCRVLDDTLGEVSDATGELYVEGAGIARGYLGQSGLTATHFVANPWSAHGARMYRTGDLVSVVGDDRYFEGRRDRQLSVGGVRVEAAEVEDVLKAIPEIDQARSWVDTAGPRPVLRACVVGGGLLLGQRELLEHLRAHLPHHSVPVTVTRVDRLPVTAHGKLDTDAVRSAASRHSGEDCIRSPLEIVVVEAFRQVLGDSSITTVDDFFECGGDSLAAGRLTALLRRLLGGSWSVATVFQERTSVGIAAFAARANGFGERDRMTVLRARGRGIPIFCIAPEGGLGWHYLSLLDRVPEAHPVVLLQSPDGESDAKDFAVKRIMQLESDRTIAVVGIGLGALLAMDVVSELGAISTLDVHGFVGVGSETLPDWSDDLAAGEWWRRHCFAWAGADFTLPGDDLARIGHVVRLDRRRRGALSAPVPHHRVRVVECTDGELNAVNTELMTWLRHTTAELR